MFDDLRQDAEQGYQQEDEDGFLIEETPQAKSKLILGMTAPQRFLISVMLLVWVSVVSCFMLMVTNKIVF